MGEVAHKEGRTVLFVSHNMGAISQLCSRSIWLDGGQVQQMGATDEIVAAYSRCLDAAGGSAEAGFAPDPDKESQLLHARLLDSDGQLTQSFQCDEPVVLELIYQVRRVLPGLYGYLQISRTDGTRVLVSDSMDTVPNPMDGLAVGTHTLTVTVPARTLAPGEYTVYLNFTSPAGRHFDVDSPGIVGSFRLDDYTSRRGNGRPGFFSTLLHWEVR
jgi:lipopolysaccharide transport system ATP-binding protein